MRKHVSRARSEGFTLLEVLLAVALTAGVIAGVFGVASGAFELNAEVGQRQEREMTRQAFVELCRRNFLGYSGQGRLSLRVEEAANESYHTYLELEGDPLAFAFGPGAGGARRVVLYAEEEAGGKGLLEVGLRYYGEESIRAGAGGGGDGAGEAETVLPLLSEVGVFELRLWDAAAGNWVNRWEPGRGRPGMVEMILGFADEAPRRHVFWLPPAIAPGAMPVLESGGQPASSGTLEGMGSTSAPAGS